MPSVEDQEAYAITNPNNTILHEACDSEGKELYKNARCHYTMSDFILVHGSVDEAVRARQCDLDRLVRNWMPVETVINRDKVRKESNKPLLFSTLKDFEQIMVTHGCWKNKDNAKLKRRTTRRVCRVGSPSMSPEIP